jgi:hypothetical protein
VISGILDGDAQPVELALRFYEGWNRRDGDRRPDGGEAT